MHHFLETFEIEYAEAITLCNGQSTYTDFIKNLDGVYQKKETFAAFMMYANKVFAELDNTRLLKLKSKIDNLEKGILENSEDVPVKFFELKRTYNSYVYSSFYKQTPSSLLNKYELSKSHMSFGMWMFANYGFNYKNSAVYNITEEVYNLLIEYTDNLYVVE